MSDKMNLNKVWNVASNGHSPYNPMSAAEKHGLEFLRRAGLQADPRPGLDLLKGLQIKAAAVGPDGMVIRSRFDLILLRNVITELEANGR